MPKIKSLTSTQKAVLVRAGRNRLTATDVSRVTGQALQRRGYGYYFQERRTFHLNAAGARYAETGEQEY